MCLLRTKKDNNFKLLLALVIIVCNISFVLNTYSQDIAPEENQDISKDKPTITFIGDSIVYGVGDNPRPNGRSPLGYVGRVARKVQNRFIIEKHGFPGVTTFELFRKIKKSFANSRRFRPLRRGLLEAEYVFFDLGRNDYWRSRDASKTVRMIIKSAKLINRQRRKLTNKAPIIGGSLLLPTKRDFQQPFIDEVNSGLLRSNSKFLKVVFDFTQFTTEVLPEDDELHPDPNGYMQIAQMVRRRLVSFVNN